MAGIPHARHETGADALDRVRALLPTGQHRRGIRLDATILTPGFWPSSFADAGHQSTAGADAGNEISTWPSVSRQISSAVVLRWISGWPVLELLRDEVAGSAAPFPRLGDGATHTPRPRRQDQPARRP